MTDPCVRLHAVVRGRVQGVGYRVFVIRHAERLGLRGTVANLPDGRVECIVEGPRPAIDELGAQLRKGPLMARVAGVETTESQCSGTVPPMRVSG
ncbi:MAG TPA: acylphosphatase [Candidatus Dormibacteraeota bacterium]|nr:acylphosphatase [Candidatus Dormibacteraeota bacterium]